MRAFYLPPFPSVILPRATRIIEPAGAPRRRRNMLLDSFMSAIPIIDHLLVCIIDPSMSALPIIDRRNHDLLLRPSAVTEKISMATT